MKNIKFGRIFTVVSVYLSAIIGAGFATGAEIIEYFLIYKRDCIWGIFLMGALFFLIGYFVMENSRKNHFQTVKEYLSSLLGKTWGKYCHLLITIFLFFTYSTMISGGSQLISYYTPIPYSWSGCIISVLCLAIFLSGSKWFIDVNKFLAPFIVIGIIASCILVVYNRDAQAVFANGLRDIIEKKWFLGAIIYVSYNSLLSIVVLLELGKTIKTTQEARLSAMVASISIVCIAGTITAILAIFYGKIDLLPMPIITIMTRMGQYYSIVYGIVLFLAIITTAISNAFGVLEYFKTFFPKSEFFHKIFLVILAYIVSQVGFTYLVKYVYSFFGIIGILLIAVILYKGIRQMIKK